MSQAFRFRSPFMTKPTLPGESEVELEEPSHNAHLDLPDGRGTRAELIYENMDALALGIQHARRASDQMLEEISRLESEAGTVQDLRDENSALREKLDQTSDDLASHETSVQELTRERAQLKQELERLREESETHQRDASAKTLKAERAQDKLTASLASLQEANHELQIEKDAHSKTQTNSDWLRAQITERDDAIIELKERETDLCLLNDELKTQLEGAKVDLSQTERRLADKTAQLETVSASENKLDLEVNSLRDKLCSLHIKHNELLSLNDTRLDSLQDELDQARANKVSLAADCAAVREQNSALDHTLQQTKSKLVSAQAQSQQSTNSLEQANKQLDAAYAHIARLTSENEKIRNEEIALQRQAKKAEQLQRENADLREQIAYTHERFARYRSRTASGGSGKSQSGMDAQTAGDDRKFDEVPFLLAKAQRAMEAAKGAKGKQRDATPMAANAQAANVTRIANR